MSTDINTGQVRGPVQMTFGQSVEPIVPQEISITRMNIAGVADVVEFHTGPDGETPFPIEYKRGKPKLHRADEVQLCAQAICLEEMTSRPVPAGALFYGETKRRVGVPFDAELRKLTEDMASRPARARGSKHNPALAVKLADGRAPRGRVDRNIGNGARKPNTPGRAPRGRVDRNNPKKRIGAN